MFRYLILFLLLSSAMAHAAPSLRIDNKVLNIGDSAARVQEQIGDPMLRTFEYQQVTGVPGTEVVEDWQYAQDGKTVVIIIIDGRVAHFETQHT
jgi:hypothetical protein